MRQTKFKWEKIKEMLKKVIFGVLLIFPTVIPGFSALQSDLKFWNSAKLLASSSKDTVVGLLK